jgi:beta-glucanase (GH16 family)
MPTAIGGGGGNYSRPAAPILGPFPDPMGQTPGVWTGVFRDEFTSGSLDSSKWDYAFPNLSFYTATPNGGRFTNDNSNDDESFALSQISFDSNGLVLTAIHQAQSGVSTKPYTSGMISSYPAFTATSGYFEAKMQGPLVGGMWWSFWLTPIQSWPPEVDIMEQYGNRNAYLANTFRVSDSASISTQVVSDASQWHVYGFKWTATSQTWYLDGVQQTQVTDATYMTTTPMFMMVDLAVNSTDVNLNPANYPQSIHCRYVRAWV